MAQTKPKAGQFYGVSGNGTDGQFLQTDGAGGMTWADTTIDPTLSSIDYPGSATAADPAGDRGAEAAAPGRELCCGRRGGAP